MFIENVNAYKEGYQASVRTNSNPKLVRNPYPKDSAGWKSWNKGWNSHFDLNWEK